MVIHVARNDKQWYNSWRRKVHINMFYGRILIMSQNAAQPHEKSPLLRLEDNANFASFAEKDKESGKVKSAMSNFYLNKFALSVGSFLLTLVYFFTPIPGVSILLEWILPPILALAAGYRSHLNALEYKYADNINFNLWQKIILNASLALAAITLFVASLISLATILAFITAYVSVLSFVTAAAYTGKFVFKAGLAIQQTVRYFRSPPGSERREECKGRLIKYWLSAASSLAIAVTAFCVGITGVFTGGTSNLIFGGIGVFLGGLNAWYSTIPQFGNHTLPVADANGAEKAKAFEPDSPDGLFFYKDIIATMKSIQKI